MRLLLVEDELELGKVVRDLLVDHGFTVDIAPELSWAKEAIQQADYDLVVLDRRLPDGDGIDLVEHAKQATVETRFLFLTALGNLEDKVDCLDVGGDDYMVKPFEPDELLARIRALLRRPLSRTSDCWVCGRVELDVKTRTVLVDGKSLVLSRRELSVLECLIRRAGYVVTREHIEEAVYGYDDEIASNTLESHVSRLRKLLAQYEAGVAIRAIRGVGYVMRESDG